MTDRCEDAAASRLIVFLVPPARIVSGGVLSIFSLCSESRRFAHLHGAEVLLCTYPATASYRHNDLFENDEYILSFDEVVERHPTLESLLLHIPADVVKQVYDGLQPYGGYLSRIRQLHLNILNQNLELMGTVGEVASLFTLTPTVTQTTAHDRYATQAVCDAYGIPTHHLSVYIDKAQYARVPFHEKERVIAYSNDRNPIKQAVLQKLAQELPEYRLVEIDRMPYADYKALIAKARHVITFGEGFDGYFVETIFSGGVPLAAYSDTFFPSADYLRFGNVYEDYSQMLADAGRDIRAMDEAAYTGLNEDIYAELIELYDFAKYLENLEKFYLGEYRFSPSAESVRGSLITAIREKDALIDAARRRRRRRWFAYERSK